MPKPRTLTPRRAQPLVLINRFLIGLRSLHTGGVPRAPSAVHPRSTRFFGNIGEPLVFGGASDEEEGMGDADGGEGAAGPHRDASQERTGVEPPGPWPSSSVVHDSEPLEAAKVRITALVREDALIWYCSP